MWKDVLNEKFRPPFTLCLSIKMFPFDTLPSLLKGCTKLNNVGQSWIEELNKVDKVEQS